VRHAVDQRRADDGAALGVRDGDDSAREGDLLSATARPDAKHPGPALQALQQDEQDARGGVAAVAHAGPQKRDPHAPHDGVHGFVAGPAARRRMERPNGNDVDGVTIRGANVEAARQRPRLLLELRRAVPLSQRDRQRDAEAREKRARGRVRRALPRRSLQQEQVNEREQRAHRRLRLSGALVERLRAPGSARARLLVLGPFAGGEARLDNPPLRDARRQNEHRHDSRLVLGGRPAPRADALRACRRELGAAAHACVVLRQLGDEHRCCIHRLSLAVRPVLRPQRCDRRPSRASRRSSLRSAGRACLSHATAWRASSSSVAACSHRAPASAARLGAPRLVRRSWNRCGRVSRARSPSRRGARTTDALCNYFLLALPGMRHSSRTLTDGWCTRSLRALRATPRLLGSAVGRGGCRRATAAAAPSAP
jgi:hypothetical protein